MSKFIDDQLAMDPNASAEVLGFIDNFLGEDPDESEIIRHKFRAGYCWHFAHILQATFGMGICCLTFPFGHFVWFGKDWIPYDIEGVYMGEADCFIPEHLMLDELPDFKRIPGEYISNPNDVLERSISIINKSCSYSTFDARAWMCNLSERDKEYMRNNKRELYDQLQRGKYEENFSSCRDLACKIPDNYMLGVVRFKRPIYKQFLNNNDSSVSQGISSAINKMISG